MSFELTAMKLILQWYFFFSFGFVIDCQENRYGLKGSSIQLSISPRNQSHQQDELNELKNIKWRRFNRRHFLGDKDGVPPGFKKRMSLNNSDWSLTIHNLQEDDGGLYEALSKHEDEILAAFTLIVENTVSKPIIKVNQYDFNSSAACRATVNCSADGSWATYDCDQNFCTAAQSSQFSINITVTAVDSNGIKCNAKNHVSKNHSTAPNIRCREKQQSDFPYSPPLIVWIIVTVIGGVFLGLVMGVIVVFVKRRKCSKVHPQSSRVVIEQHHETIYCTVEKPAAPQTSPVNNAASNKVETIYDTPSRHTKACQVDSVEVMRDKQEQQQSGQDGTIQVKATVHQAAEPDSDPINTVYCKLGEI